LSAAAGFLAWFLVTLALLVLVVLTGLAARRRWHIAWVVASMCGLVMTIRHALLLGEICDLAAAGVITPIHHTLARITTVAYLLPIATGIRTIFVPATRRLHRRFAFLVLGMTILTAITGTVMIYLSPRVPSPE